MIKILPIILCGGSGTRLWPLSRTSFPKQYLKVDEKEKLSFLQKTVKRLEYFQNIDKPIIICNEEHRFIVAEQMRDIKILKNKYPKTQVGITSIAPLPQWLIDLTSS